MENNETPKRPRGRPPKPKEDKPKRPVGRPPKPKSNAPKRPRGRPPRKKNPFEDTKFLEAAKLHNKDLTDPATLYEGDNAQIMAHNLQLYALPKIDTHNAEQVQERTELYFRKCAENDMRPSVAGYALALGVNRRSLYEWLAGISSRPTDVLEVIGKAYSMLNAQMEDLMQNNKINPIMSIFLAKNNLGYKDQTELVVSGGGVEKTAEQLIAEAEELSKME